MSKQKKIRRVGATVAALVVAVSMSVTAFASEDTKTIAPPGDEPGSGSSGGAPTLVQQNGDGYSSITIHDGVTEIEGPQFTGEEQNSLQTTGQTKPTRYYPFEITNVDERGVLLVVKSYQIPADADPELLIEYDVERDGIIYEARDILQKKAQGSTDTKEVSKKVTITTESKDKAKILTQLDEATFYSEGGYEGYLSLDPDSITTEVSGTSNYSYPITEKKEFTGLEQNDPSLIDSQITKNGVILKLSDVKWTSMGSTVSNGLIVSTYKAVATYTGTSWGSKADGYIVTASYKGSVTKEEAGDHIYSIIYAPAKDQAAARAQRATGNPGGGSGSSQNASPAGNEITLGEDSGSLNFLDGLQIPFAVKILGATVGAALVVVLVILFILKIKSKRSDNEDAPEDEEEYPMQPYPRTATYETAPTVDDGVELGDMRVYMPNDGVLNIEADDDAELSAMFEQDGGPDSEPPMN